MSGYEEVSTLTVVFQVKKKTLHTEEVTEGSGVHRHVKDLIRSGIKKFRLHFSHS